MGWLGDRHTLQYFLSVIGADKDEDGKVKWYGTPPILFMGIGPDVLVADDAEVLIQGRRTNVAAAINTTSYRRPVTVI